MTDSEDDTIFSAGEGCFAKVRGFPPWPAVLATVTKDKAEVVFFGTNEKSTLHVKDLIKATNENVKKMQTPKLMKKKRYKEGLAQLDKHLCGKPTELNLNEKTLKKVALTMADDDQEYIVEKIKEKRVKRGKIEYLVKWKHFDDPAEDTWEPAAKLKEVDWAIEDFEKKIPENVEKIEVVPVDRDLYKKTFYSVTPSRRQLERGASGNSSQVAAAIG